LLGRCARDLIHDPIHLLCLPVDAAERLADRFRRRAPRKIDPAE